MICSEPVDSVPAAAKREGAPPCASWKSYRPSGAEQDPMFSSLLLRRVGDRLKGKKVVKKTHDDIHNLSVYNICL